LIQEKTLLGASSPALDQRSWPCLGQYEHGGTLASKTKTRTINFFEIVRWINSSKSVRFDHADWQQVLKGLRHTDLEERVWDGGDRTLIGEVLFVDGTLHLKLMSVRDEAAWLEVYKPSAKSIEELTLGNDAVLVETSIVAFLGYGNVVGLIQGSTAAPTATSLERWVNGLELFANSFQIETRAMVSHEAQKKLQQSDEVSSVSVKVHTNKADVLEARHSKLAGLMRQIRQDFGDMTVTVTLNAGRSKDQAEARSVLRRETDNLLSAADAKEVAQAKAKLVYYSSDEKSRTEEVNFIKQRITAKREIAATNDEGDPIRNSSAVHAILEVARQHHEELSKIVEEESP